MLFKVVVPYYRNESQLGEVAKVLRRKGVNIYDTEEIQSRVDIAQNRLLLTSRPLTIVYCQGSLVQYLKVKKEFKVNPI